MRELSIKEEILSAKDQMVKDFEAKVGKSANEVDLKYVELRKLQSDVEIEQTIVGELKIEVDELKLERSRILKENCCLKNDLEGLKNEFDECCRDRDCLVEDVGCKEDEVLGLQERLRHANAELKSALGN